MNAEPDQPVAVRAGEELPLDRLANYLQQELAAAGEPVSLEQFPGGYSNLTYLVRIGRREFVLRRPPFGNKVASAHDMSREYRVLSKLSAVYPPAPRPELFCDDESVIGCPFYLMERRQGVILRKQLPPGIAINPDMARCMSQTLIDSLAALHAVDYQAAGLSDLGKPEGYVQRQVSGWSRRYEQARTTNVPAMDAVSQWLEQHLPIEVGARVIHNDFKYDNVILKTDDLTGIVAVLDWEMATLGDPLMDLGTSLGYWVQRSDPMPLQQAAFGPTTLPGSLTRRELVERYQEQSGVPVSDPVFYYCFGLFKLAVIVQQIYARFARGTTRDSRFAQLDQLVLLLSEQADRTLNLGVI